MASILSAEFSSAETSFTSSAGASSVAGVSSATVSATSNALTSADLGVSDGGTIVAVSKLAPVSAVGVISSAAGDFMHLHIFIFMPQSAHFLSSAPASFSASSSSSSSFLASAL